MSHGLGVREAMVVYVDGLNFESSERYEREMKEHNAWLLSSKSRDTEENPEQSHEPEPAEMETPDGNTQNISTPSSQNISPPPILDPPYQISSTLPLPASLPPTAPITDPQQGEQRTGADPNAPRTFLSPGTYILFP